MKTINKVILVIDAILGVTLVAYTWMAKKPEDYALLLGTGITLNIGIMLTTIFLLNDLNKERVKICAGVMGLILTFVIMVAISSKITVTNTVFVVFGTVLVVSLLCCIMYNIAIWRGNRKEKR